MNNQQQDSHVQIVKSSRHSLVFVSRYNIGKFEIALNWHELQYEATLAIEPELRRRWLQYWNALVARAAVVCDAIDATEMMDIEAIPSDSYPCPLEIAARAIWPTALPGSSIMMVEAGS